MAPIKFINLLAISSLAILACSFGATSANALATEGHLIREVSHGHGAVAKRKRESSTPVKRCKKKPSSSSPSTSKATGKASTGNNAKAASGGSSSKSADPAKSTKSTSSTPPVTAYSGKSKAGLAWPNGNDPSLKNFKTDKVKPLYTWSPDIPSSAKSLGFLPIPQLWGDRQTASFKKTVVKGYANIVLGFNEPNEPGQSNMKPEHGAELWKQYIEPLKNEGYALISPATSSNPNGKVWVADFMKACNGGCHLDGVAVHYYDITPEGFIKYIEDWHNTYKLPIYPTEFACQNFNGGAQCSKDQVYNFMNKVVSYMEAADWVPMYFAFGVMKDMQGVNTLNQLMNSAGQPTDLGKMYIGA